MSSRNIPKVIAGRTTLWDEPMIIEHLVSMSIEEQESLEGHSLHSFSLSVHDSRFLFDTRYRQDMLSSSTLLVL